MEFSPAEATSAQQLPSSETGVWYPVPGALAGGALVLATVDGTTWVVVGYMTPGGKYPATQDGVGMIMREAMPLGNGFLIVTEGGPSPVHIYEP